MSAKRDRPHNEMVIPFYHASTMTEATGTYNSTAYDSMLGRSNPTNMLLILMMSSWSAAGHVVVRVQDSMTQAGTFVTFKNFARATQASGNVTFVGQADRFRRWIRLRIDVVGTVTLTAVGVLARGRREPVTQQASVGSLSSGSSESSSESSSSSSDSSSSSESSSSSS
jgi:hypothetical protein